MAFLDSDTEAPPALLQQYSKALELAKNEDLSEFDRQGLVRSLGLNKSNEEVVLVTPCFLSGEPDQLERAMHYGLSKLQHCEHTPFALVFALTYTNWLRDSSTTYLKQCSMLVPFSIKKNLKKIYLLHWTVAMKLFLAAASTMVPPKFWEKVVYLEKLSDILSTLKTPPDEALARFPYVVQHEEEMRIAPGNALSIFGTPVEILSQRIPFALQPPYTRLPSIYVDFVFHLTQREVLLTKDLLHLQADCVSLYAFVGDVDSGNPAVEWSNVRALVTAFRLLFDALDVPLLGRQAYPTFLTLSKAALKPDKGKIQAALRKLYDRLTRGEQETFTYLLDTFRKVAAEADKNGMTSAKIAEVFGPSFCRPVDKPDAQLPVVSHVAVEALRLAIENPQWFPLSAKAEEEESSSEEEESEEEEEESSSEESDAAPAPKKPAAAPPAATAAAKKAAAPAVPAAAATAAPAPAAAAASQTKGAAAAPAAAAAKPTPTGKKRETSSSSSEEEEEEEESSEEEEEEDEE